jgi:glyoxylase-like metal-dependent hydrolase (beta-lactamase superfamily II)
LGRRSLIIVFGTGKRKTVVEAPLSEARSLAVIEEVVRLVPGKPIRSLVNTHQHFDHIGGLRTYLHIGATIVTHAKNYDFYNRDVLNYTPRTLLLDMVSLWPPTESPRATTSTVRRPGED